MMKYMRDRRHVAQCLERDVPEPFSSEHVVVESAKDLCENVIAGLEDTWRK